MPRSRGLPLDICAAPMAGASGWRRRVHSWPGENACMWTDGRGRTGRHRVGSDRSRRVRRRIASKRSLWASRERHLFRMGIVSTALFRRLGGKSTVCPLPVCRQGRPAARRRSHDSPGAAATRRLEPVDSIRPRELVASSPRRRVRVGVAQRALLHGFRWSVSCLGDSRFHFAASGPVPTPDLPQHFAGCRCGQRQAG